ETRQDSVSCHAQRDCYYTEQEREVEAVPECEIQGDRMSENGSHHRASECRSKKCSEQPNQNSRNGKHARAEKKAKGCLVRGERGRSWLTTEGRPSNSERGGNHQRIADDRGEDE